MADFTEIFVWGSDHFGQLGLGSTQHKTFNIPKFCSFNILISSISCGDQHSGFLSAEGHVYTMGSNIDGRLGINSSTIKFSASPILVESLKDQRAVHISCGGGHSLLITTDSNLYTWGYGELGALGTGSTQTQYSPILIKLPEGVRPIEGSCGSKHSALIARGRDCSNIVLTCGNGDSGQLGTGQREKEFAFSPIRLPEEIVQVSCGVFHTGFVGVAGGLYMTGGNSFGQLGIGSKKGTCVAKRVEALAGCRVVKVSCSNHSVALSDRGEVFIWGDGLFTESLVPQLVLREGRDIAVGGTFTVVVDINDTVMTWGGNLNGELGVGDFEPRPRPEVLASLRGKRVSKLACGSNFTVALGEDTKYNLTKPRNYSASRQLRNGSGKNGTSEPEYDKVAKSYGGTKTEKRVSKPSPEYIYEERLPEAKSAYTKLTNDSGDTNVYKEEVNKLYSMLELEREKTKRLQNDYEEQRNLNESLRQYQSLKQHEEMSNQAQAVELQRMRLALEDSKNENYSLGLENKALREELERMQVLIRQQENEAKENLRLRLASREEELECLYANKIEIVKNELDNVRMQQRQTENNLAQMSIHKNRLEDTLATSNLHINDLTSQKAHLEENLTRLNSQIESLKAQLSDSISTSNKHKSSYEELLYEFESFKQESMEKESQRDIMVNLIEEKAKEIEHEREKLLSERDSLSRVVNDLTYEISRLNKSLSENAQLILDMEKRLSEENENSAKLMIDLETCKEEVILLELKNTEIFENLQKELGQRAKEYKERTLNLLNTPARARSPPREMSGGYERSPSGDTTVIKSPVREGYSGYNAGRSPGKVENSWGSAMPSIELIAKTPHRTTGISRTQQERIAAAAMRLVQRPESPLKNIRVSSPSRASPDRPKTYTRYIRNTPDQKNKNYYNV